MQLFLSLITFQRPRGKLDHLSAGSFRPFQGVSEPDAEPLPVPDAISSSIHDCESWLETLKLLAFVRIKSSNRGP
jgi:hypothetical protein